MRKFMFFTLAMFLLAAPVMIAIADDDVQGDDPIETVFKGIVTDAETGDPIENAEIYGFEEGYSNWKIDYTDEKGFYYLEFYKGGTFHIFAEHGDYYQEEFSLDVEVNQETILDIELGLKEFDTTIFGIVTDSESNEPLSDVFVEVYELLEDEDGYWYSFVDYFITNEDGYYLFDVIEGTFSIDAYKEGYDYFWKEEFFIESGDKYELNIEMEQWTQMVEGKVTDENNKPLESVTVSVENEYMRWNTETDENGNYKIRVSHGDTYTLSAQEDGYRPYVTSLEIEDGEKVEHNIVMEESYLPPPILQLVYIILTLLGGI